MPSGWKEKNLIKRRVCHLRKDALCLAYKAQCEDGGRIEPFCCLATNILHILLSSS